MDLGDRQQLAGQTAAAFPDDSARPTDAPPDSGGDIPAPPVAFFGPMPSAASPTPGARHFLALALSGVVHAGALAAFIFAAPSEHSEVLEIPVEMVEAAQQPEALQIDHTPASIVEPEAAAVEPLREPESPAAVAEAAAVPPLEPVAEPLPPELEAERAPEAVAAPAEPEAAIAPAPEASVAALAPALPDAPAPFVAPPPVARPSPVRPPVETEASHRPELPKPPRRVVEDRKPAPWRIAARPHAEKPDERVRTALPPPASRSASAAPPAPSAASIGAWRSAIAAKIAANKAYPDSARGRGASGTTVVSLSIGPGGQLAGASLTSSSGHADLDAASVSAVRRAAPFPPPPPGAPRAFSVPFRYGLR